MVDQPQQEERDPRSVLRVRRSRIVRYGLRALVFTAGAGAVWFLGSQAANADSTSSPHHPQTCDGLTTASQGTTAQSHQMVGSGSKVVAESTCTVQRTAPTALTGPKSISGLQTVVPAGLAPGGVRSGNTRPVAESATVAGSPNRPPTASVPTRDESTTSRDLLGQLGSSARPVADATQPVTAPLTGSLATSTRPVHEPVGGADRPLPGSFGTDTAPVTGVLAGATDRLSGVSSVGLGPLPASLPVPAPFQVSDLEGGSPVPALPVARHAGVGQDGSADSFATWTSGATTAPMYRSLGAGGSAPGLPEPTPFPADTGSGLPCGGMATSFAVHTDGGSTAPVMSRVVRADDSASRVRLATTKLGLPREREEDPAVSPD